MLDVGLYIGYTLLIVAVLAAVVLPLIKAVQSPAELLKSLYGVVALLVIFGIAYAVSGSGVRPNWAVVGVGEGTSKLIGAGLITFYIVVVIAFAGLIFSEINKALK